MVCVCDIAVASFSVLDAIATQGARSTYELPGAWPGVEAPAGSPRGPVRVPDHHVLDQPDEVPAVDDFAALAVQRCLPLEWGDGLPTPTLFWVTLVSRSSVRMRNEISRRLVQGGARFRRRQVRLTPTVLQP